MKHKIVHLFGNIDDYDLQTYRLNLDPEDTKESEILDNGWFVFNGRWIANRLVRLDLSKYTKQPKQIKGYEFVFKEHLDDLTEVDRVFQIFVKLRGLSQIYSITCDPERTSWLLVYKEGKLVAFTKFTNYEGALESQFTAWDYSEPRISLGIKIVDYEVMYAKEKGYPYLYIGPGYGAIAAYKSRFEGFQWWTGSEWCLDVDKYINACNRDSSIKTLDDLNKLFNDPNV